MEYKFYYWGPYLQQVKIPKDVGDELLNRGERLKNVKEYDFREKLAGDIRHEYKYPDIDKKYFVENTVEIFNNYMIQLKNWVTVSEENNSNAKILKMEDLWINFMGSNEYNPIHTHSGDLSFVIYLKVADELKMESHTYKGTSAGPGKIEFIYGEKQGNCITGHSFLPEQYDMFIFPATLKHFVYPYKSDVERVSVSGNIVFEKQNNNLNHQKVNYEDN